MRCLAVSPQWRIQKNNSHRRSLKVRRDRERVPIWIHYPDRAAIPQETADLALCLQPGRTRGRLGRGLGPLYDVTKGTHTFENFNADLLEIFEENSLTHMTVKHL